MVLNVNERQHPAVQKLMVHLKERLEQLRAQNEGVHLTESETAILRGRIAEIKAMLELDKDQPVVEKHVVARF